VIQSIKWNGRPIDTPGCYEGLPISLYHSQLCCRGPSVSSSNLRRCLVVNGGSPAHFYVHWSGNPNRVEQPESVALIMGRAVHHLLLGQPRFAAEFVVRPDEIGGKPWHGNRLECKAWLREQEEAGLTVLKPEWIEDIKGMALSLGRNPLIQNGILNGLIERSIIMSDRETGLWIKVRPDAIPTDSGDFSDLKTTTSVQWPDIVKTITNYTYAQQAALCRTAAREVLQMDMQSWSLVFIEKEPPYCARVAQLKPPDIDLGERLNRLALRAIARGLETGDWPGPAEIDGQDGAFVDQVDAYRERARKACEMAEDAMNEPLRAERYLA